LAATMYCTHKMGFPMTVPIDQSADLHVHLSVSAINIFHLETEVRSLLGTLRMEFIDFTTFLKDSSTDCIDCIGLILQA
jgi:hypothetical protein